MNILLLGSGGREHALAWKICQSPLCTALYIGPGNAGTALCGTNVPLDILDFDAVKAVILERSIDMVMVGPEVPLARGLYDYVRADAALDKVAFIGPSKAGARLESSKVYAKRFMQDFGIPTAGYRSFGIENLREGLAYIAMNKPPVVLKADGLAAGKGVVICKSVAEAQEEFEAMLKGKFGMASECVLVEKFLSGREFSAFAITDGKTYKMLPTAKDYKRIGEGDTGLNTGGMGAISPVPFLDKALWKKVEKRVVQRTIRGLQARGIVYQGFLFFGLIEVAGEPYVIEYNCRMGDPETEVVIPRLEGDLVAMCQALAAGQLGGVEVSFDKRHAATVMLVSGGYPAAYEKGKRIGGLDNTTGGLVFHAGTRLQQQGVVTNGGRVLALTSLGNSLQEALAASYKNAESIRFEGKYYRRDIGSGI